ncbi:MAG TPA: FixH family protein [Capsulimonadaceae bacterium]|jgi:hypothetical protein
MNKRLRVLLVALAGVIGLILYLQTGSHFTLPTVKDESTAKTGIEFSFDTPPKILKPAAFTVNVTMRDHDTTVPVKVEFVMPEMKMPTNIVTPTGKDSVYKGSAMLTMSGKWLAIITVRSKTGPIVDQMVPFNVP